jgi:hypothetical protein
VPTLFPFVELQAKLVGRYAAGDYALPSPAEMKATIVADQKRMWGDATDRPRHTMQIDHNVYEHDIQAREMPAGRERALRGEGVSLPGNAAAREPAPVG